MLGEELNYRRAAERLSSPSRHCRPRSSSSSISSASRCSRATPREVALTDEGRAGLPRVQEALRGVDLAVENLVSLAGAHQGESASVI